MTPPPRPGGNPGDYEERVAQWLLEIAFFRDFIYRNPASKGGQGELADTVVLFDDVVLMNQTKAQFSERPGTDWAAGAIREKLRQLHHTHRMLRDGHVRTLQNEFHGSLEFEARASRAWIGLIILDQEPEPFDPRVLVPELEGQPFGVHVLSLRDFSMLAERFDTAADMISYLEYRHDLRNEVPCFVHAEEKTLCGVVAKFEELNRRYEPNLAEDILTRSVAAFRAIASGQLLRDPDWRFGLAVDDIIAHCHERDPELPWNQAPEGTEVGLKVAVFLGWLTRERRILLGKKMLSKTAAARDGGDHYFSHWQRPTGTTLVFLATSRSRAERVDWLKVLCVNAQARHGTERVLGVATEPIGPGRSYDFYLVERQLTKEDRERILAVGDFFGENRRLGTESGKLE